VSGQQLTAGYLGGIYSLDGYYPGWTAHALIANGILSMLNTKFGTTYAMASVATQYAGDPAVRLVPFVKRKTVNSPENTLGKQNTLEGKQ
jgi:hypothetical protein